jgi:hypothetical protein
MDKLDVCLFTIDVVTKFFKKKIRKEEEYPFEFPLVNLSISLLDDERMAELDTVDAFHEYTVVLNRTWLVVDKPPLDEIVGVIGHEMTHVYQMCREAIEELPQEGKSKKAYWFSPYEIEARGYEKAFTYLVNEKLTR